MKRLFLATFLFFSTFFSGFAQISTVAPVATNAAVTFTLRPIDARFTTLEGMTYVMNGENLQTYDDFHEVIDPLKDYEAKRLLDRSQAADDLAKIFKIIGFAAVAGGVAGILTTSKSSDQTNFLLAAVGGELTFDVGLLFGAESQTTKFNAVQRYNRFAYGREQILPQAPMDEKSLLPGSSPVVTPVPTITVIPTTGSK